MFPVKFCRDQYCRIPLFFNSKPKLIDHLLNIPWGEQMHSRSVYSLDSELGFVMFLWSKHKNYMSCIVLALLDEVKCVEH